MARTAKMTRGGPGYVGLIVFVVLCLILIGGYVVLFPAYAKRGSAVMRMNDAVKSNLEQPLGKALSINATPTASPAEAAYDQTFFSKVRDAALKGIKYDEMVTVTGYGGETPVADMDAELAKLTPKPLTLRDELNRLRQDISTLQGRLNDSNTALDAAKTDRDNAQKAKVAAETRLKENLDAKNKEIADFRKKDADELADLKTRWQTADAAEKKARAAAAAEATQFKKQIADLNDSAKMVEQKIVALQEEVNRKKPKPIPVLEGTVLKASLVEGAVYINLGKNQGIQMGEKFNVVAVGRGGVKVPKGEVVVVRVDPEISRADITGPAFENPIVAGDVVVREKKFEEAPESAAPAKK